ncbi:DUF1638 domain-containing protein [Desulfatiferula olefinivorans]
MKQVPLILCCSVLKREILSVLGTMPEADGLVFLDSMLHMRPLSLHRDMQRVLSEQKNRPCLIVYGDCHAHMHEMEQVPGRVRLPGVNCAELLLGPERYAACRREKTFLFLPEWTERWQEVFHKELGFSDRELAREFMGETRKRLAYLDTGLVPVPTKTLDDIASFFNMPVETIPAPLDHLARAVETALMWLDKGPNHES